MCLRGILNHPYRSLSSYELLGLDIEPTLAKHCAEMVVDPKNEKDFPVLVKEAYELALRGEKSPATSTKPEKTKKAKAKYTEGDIRQIVDEAKKDKISAYEALQKAGIVRDATIEDFLS
jgi:NACalpha-BTF3-like transcription factor